MGEKVIVITEHPGYEGAFTTNEHLGAYRNGTRIVKHVSEKGDTTPTGTLGTVLGSLGHPDVGVFYFVEWDNRPKTAVGVMAVKIRYAGPWDGPNSRPVLYRAEALCSDTRMGPHGPHDHGGCAKCSRR